MFYAFLPHNHPVLHKNAEGIWSTANTCNHTFYDVKDYGKFLSSFSGEILIRLSQNHILLCAEL